MNRRKRNTRGVTLAELCIVMAVIAIVSTMVVSFTVLMQARTRVIAADRNTVADIGLVEAALDRFIGTYDSDEYTLAQSDPIWTSDNPLLYKLDTKYTSISVLKKEAIIAKLKLSIDPDTEKVNAIVITDGDDKAEITYLLNSVTKMTFELEGGNSSGSATALVICRVEYTSTHGNEQVTKTSTICRAVRAMKFVAASPDLETVKLAVSEFLKNYGTEDYTLGFDHVSNSSQMESAYNKIIATNTTDNKCYVLTPKFSGGKITGLHLYVYGTGTQPESDTTLAMYPLCNITKIEYITPSEGEVTRPSSITCKVTYTDTDGTEKNESVFLWLSNVSVLPVEGGIEP